MNKLPIYKAVIRDVEDGVYSISLVDSPAIDVNFMYFNDDKTKYNIYDEEKRIIVTPILRSNYKIYRNIGGNEFYIEFDKQTIEEIVLKYFKQSKQSDFDTYHNSVLEPGLTLYESWIIDKSHGKMPPKGFEFLNDGDWVGTIKVDNDDIWNKIKSKEFKGVSITGLFNTVKVEMQDQFRNEMIEIYNKLKEYEN